MSNNDVLYVFDASALIRMSKYFRIGIAKQYWKKIEVIVSEDRFKAPKEVFTELERKTDELSDWMKKHRRKIELHSSEFRERVVLELQRENQDWIPQNPEDTIADPFVIAQALDLQEGDQQWLSIDYHIIVVSNDGKIIRVCGDKSIECIEAHEIVSKEGWEEY